MKLLLDTHALIWFINGDKQLPRKSIEIIRQIYLKLIDLEFHHRDPFDRIIIAQGLIEKMTVVTKDENFSKYGINVLWD